MAPEKAISLVAIKQTLKGAAPSEGPLLMNEIIKQVYTEEGDDDDDDRNIES